MEKRLIKISDILTAILMACVACLIWIELKEKHTMQIRTESGRFYIDGREVSVIIFKDGSSLRFPVDHTQKFNPTRTWDYDGKISREIVSGAAKAKEQQHK